MLGALTVVNPKPEKINNREYVTRNGNNNFLVLFLRLIFLQCNAILRALYQEENHKLYEFKGLVMLMRRKLALLSRLVLITPKLKCLLFAHRFLRKEEEVEPDECDLFGLKALHSEHIQKYSRYQNDEEEEEEGAQHEHGGTDTHTNTAQAAHTPAHISSFSPVAYASQAPESALIASQASQPSHIAPHRRPREADQSQLHTHNERAHKQARAAAPSVPHDLTTALNANTAQRAIFESRAAAFPPVPAYESDEKATASHVSAVDPFAKSIQNVTDRQKLITPKGYDR